MFKKISIGILAASFLSAPAIAAPFTYFAEDLTPGNTVTATVEAKRNQFLGALSGGVGTEDFESFSDGTNNPALSFTGSSGAITATLSGSGEVEGNLPSAGRFATSGSKIYETGGGGDFSISFSTAISAFGFYGTDIGDIGNQLTLRLTKSGGGIVDLAVGNGDSNGSLLFFGFIDTTDSYSMIQFLNNPGSGDVFGFDDMTIGDVGQIVNPPAVPLPAGGLLLISALGGIAVARRRKS
ncbi:VPLPA-CTERM sorting domain-containing protein [Pseudooceanicola nitratireducens]|uniref:VPLPA-CTERM protein sorting domain-containing protein n=1 Tax=Pseudooceanicola nitratireducens TaxID=517719 RepID=A0A1I1JSZ5_9RHOB|nr:VPLPA-CTERM sorting domain-containing protein [Pseudooceanicola nitratireducens]MEC7298513.1 VPLPA-CTERM sorting domain-containing protein [Pseudomonadota bacterium]MBY6158220.1 VPLPA-CTERM sorting domain-containing protein [Pseudooceanicola nitratireducens]MBY6165168.1 VPLPA-CTERM sorting domain-containing protein [Pseudooceanicola nitratireducens]MEC7792043.1 VPLPA-CTERM sorting domain-containing protein [Pseudomonadota bacterium]MEC9102711.1 VPLPA-CTERM sorting domain-containing protein 